MAVIEDLQGVEVNITVDGVNLEEHYDGELVDEPRTKTVYIK